MVFLTAGPDIRPIQELIVTWTHIGQALVGSIGALAFFRVAIDERGSSDRRRDSGRARSGTRRRAGATSGSAFSARSHTEDVVIWASNSSECCRKPARSQDRTQPRGAS